MSQLLVRADLDEAAGPTNVAPLETFQLRAAQSREGANGPVRQCLSRRHLKAWFLIDLQPEHVRTRVVSGHVQVELPFCNLAGV